MHKVGDLIIYKTHGICQVDAICEKTVLGVSRNYYVMHPVEDPKLTISVPVDKDNVLLQDIVDRGEAEKILECFKQPGMEWIEKNNVRMQKFNEIIRTGDRIEIAKIANTLMRKKREQEANGKKFSEQDSRMLNLTQKILFKELAIALNTSFDVIQDRVEHLIEATS